MKSKKHKKLQKHIVRYAHIYFLGFFSLLLLISFAYLTSLVQSTKTAQAAGTTIFASPGDDLTAKAKSLTPGDTLILHDGTYTNSHLNADNLNGTTTAPITIEAEHDGKALIDGGGTGEVVSADGSSNIIFIGLAAAHGQGRVVSAVGNSSNITFKRITAHDTGTGNTEVFSVKEGSNNILVEDSAAWGQGRYDFLAYHATNVTFRRTWAYSPHTSNFSPAPRSCYGAYGSTGVTFENTICSHDLPDQASTDYFTPVWQTSDGPPQDNAKYFGDIFYDNWEGLWVNGSAGTGTVMKDVVLINNKQQGTFTTSKDSGEGLHWDSPNDGNLTNLTIVNNTVGYAKNDGSETLGNSVFLNNGTAITGNLTHTNLDFFGNTTVGTTLGTGDQQVDPGYNTTKYGRGAYLFIPASSPLKGKGVSGGDIGANVLYEYVNGELTTTPLWPWPMEDRIKTEAGMSPTFASGGGLWTTLDGVYGTAVAATPTVSAFVATVGIAATPTTAPPISVLPTLFCLGEPCNPSATPVITANLSPAVAVSGATPSGTAIGGSDFITILLNFIKEFMASLFGGF